MAVKTAKECAIREKVLRPDTPVGGGVTFYELPSGTCVWRLTTFCPSNIGPGPTHLYLVRDGDELVLVDSGIDTHLAKLLLYRWRNQPIPPNVANLPDDLSERQLEEGLITIGYTIDKITRLVVTHGHFDHYLLGRKLLERNRGIEVAAHLLDTDMICNPWEVLRTWVRRRPQLLALGMPPLRGPDTIRGGSEQLALGLAVHRPIAWDGPLELRRRKSSLIEVRNLPGHSPGSVCLFVGEPSDPKIMLCGDLLLDPITPHPNNLPQYLRSLAELEMMTEVALVLPGHGLSIRDLGARVAFLKAHHRRRLKLAYERLSRPASVWDIATMDGYFDVAVDRDSFNPLAGQEAFVHVRMLELVGAVKPAGVVNGVQFFVAGSEPFEAVYERVCQFVAAPLPLAALD